MNSSREEIKNIIKKAGKYELKEENNQGMNAFAFIAKHIPFDKDVFLKIYDAPSERIDIFEEPRFLVESTAGNTNGSSFLVKVLDAEKLSDDLVLVAMEFVEGGSLLDCIKNGSLPLMDAINITKELLYGVAHLHNSLLVHRDIKPANIILKEVNGRIHPKLGDFGSVVRLSNSNSMVNASRHSALYVPPEGWENPGKYGIRSDIYQVGIVLGELLNGPLPYNEIAYLDRKAMIDIRKLGKTSFTELERYDQSIIVNESIARRTKSQNILSIIPDQPYINRTLKQIINKATTPDYSKRYNSATEMINSLNSLHFPNWKSQGNYFTAENWKKWDYAIEKITKKSGVMFNTRRSKTGCGNYRSWHITEDIGEAFNKVLKAG